MHCLYFTKIKEAQNSVEARKEASQTLDNNNFAGDGGYFSGSKADWFVVGGRWSGTFTKIFKEKEIKEAKKEIGELCKDEIEAQKKWLEEKNIIPTLQINPHLIKSDTTKKQIDEIYIKHTGTPFFKDTYIQYGYDDDAIFVDTKEKQDKIIKEYGDIEVFDGDEYDEYLMSKIGKFNEPYWLVVIDYHN